MEKVADSLDDWETAYHSEHGQTFAVVFRKGQQFEKPIEEEGPHSSLQRNGRFLFPLNFHGKKRFVTTFTQTSDMLKEQREKLHFRDDDIVIASFPRSGTTWLEQIVLLLLQKGDPSHLDTSVKNVYNSSRPNNGGKIYIDVLFHGKDNEQDVGQPWGSHIGQAILITPEQVEAIPSPRVFKTHSHPSILPGFGHGVFDYHPPDFNEFGKDIKIIYGLRDPKDVVISTYKVHLLDMMNVHKMPFTAYVKLFLNGDTLCGGHWTNHAKQWIRLEKQYPNNVMCMTYEYNSEHPLEATQQICQFLQLDLNHEQIMSSLKFSSFDQMKKMSKNAKVEHVHKGNVGGWKDVMSNEMVRAFNRLVDDPDLGEYGRRYVHPIDVSALQSDPFID